jgi:hypothetical protein
MRSIIEGIKVVNVLVPVADGLAGTKTTAPVNMAGYGRCAFVIAKGAGAVGTATFTVEMCDDAAGNNPEAIGFHYKRILANNTEGTTQLAAAAGFNSVAAASDMYMIEVSTQREGLAGGTKPFVRLKSVEVADDPQTVMVLAILSEGRYQGGTQGSAIV